MEATNIANLYIGINRGQHPSQILFGSSTNSTDMELRINLAQNLNDVDRQTLLQAIQEAMTNPQSYPAFGGFGDDNK